MKKAIESKNSPRAIGPYSQAIKINNLIFCSGQVGKDPKTNAFVEGGVDKQTKQVLENLKAVLAEVGADFSNVVKTNVYLKNIVDFPKMNEIYASYFQKPYPTRATVEVARLPQDALIEIDCIAFIDEKGCCGEGSCNCC